MTENPDQIRREIEQTRQDLAGDVDALHEKVSPSAIASRKVDSARSALSTAKDKVMGATPNGSGEGVADRVASAASSITDSVEAAPSAARRQTRGNPLAAGLIAFGAGWLVASLIPASEKEKSAATTVTDAAGGPSAVLTAPAKDIAEGLKEPARHAAESVKQTATEGATTVRDDTADAKDELVDQMRSS